MFIWLGGAIFEREALHSKLKVRDGGGNSTRHGEDTSLELGPSPLELTLHGSPPHGIYGEVHCGINPLTILLVIAQESTKKSM